MYESVNAIASAVDANEGVLSLSMLELRDAAGYGRLGVHVLAAIQDELAGLGVGHWPANLPNAQGESVRLYRRGSQVNAIIDAVANPGPDQDDVLRQAAGGGYAEILAKVRSLVCD